MHMKTTRRNLLKWLAAAPVVAPVIVKAMDTPRYTHKTYAVGFTVENAEGLSHIERLAALNKGITGSAGRVYAQDLYTDDTDAWFMR